MSIQSNSLLRRLILLGTPLAFVIVTTLHPTTGVGPGDLSLPLTRWFTVHGLQVVLTVLLAYCIWILLDGIQNKAATTRASPCRSSWCSLHL
jgi:hypothetical protein